MSVSNARAALPKLINMMSINMDRIIITVNGQPKAALVNTDELDALEETAEVLATPGAKRSILEGLKQAKKGKGKALSELN